MRRLMWALWCWLCIGRAERHYHLSKLWKRRADKADRRATARTFINGDPVGDYAPEADARRPDINEGRAE